MKSPVEILAIRKQAEEEAAERERKARLEREAAHQRWIEANLGPMVENQLLKIEEKLLEWASNVNNKHETLIFDIDCPEHRLVGEEVVKRLVGHAYKASGSPERSSWQPCDECREETLYYYRINIKL